MYVLVNNPYYLDKTIFFYNYYKQLYKFTEILINLKILFLFCVFYLLF